MKSELPSHVKKMIARVQKKKELTEPDAIAYMLGVAAGRLAALGRYGDTLPEGKLSKGVMIAGRRKRAERVTTKSAAEVVAGERKPRKPRAKSPVAEVGVP
jgi:hypothetical protein